MIAFVDDDAHATTNETSSDTYVIINGTRIVVPQPERAAHLEVSIKEKNPPIWPFQVYVENHPVGFDITVRNPNPTEYLVTVRGELWNRSPRDLTTTSYGPDSFEHTGLLLQPGGVGSTEYWTKPLLPGGYVLNVTAFQIYSEVSFPGGGKATTYSAGGHTGLSFAVYSEDSRNNLFIAVGTITAAAAAFGTVIIQSLHNRSTLTAMQRQNETSQRQLNLMREELDLERRKIHFKTLVEGSMKKWKYEPRSSGEMLYVEKGETLIGRMEVSPMYLEQGKKHLEAYTEIWQLYRDGQHLAKRKEELKQELTEIRQTIRETLMREFAAGDVKQRRDWNKDVDTWYGKINEWYNNGIETGRRVYNLVSSELGDVVFLDDLPVSKDYAEIIKPAVDSLLADEGLYQRFARANMELREIDQKIESNKTEFQHRFNTEVIEKVRVSGYEVMLGKCDQCPAPL